MALSTPQIDAERLHALLAAINGFGALGEGRGFDRRGYGDADMAARDWLAETMRADGLAVRQDAVGNVIGRFGPAEGPAVLIGSHLDTVVGGGAFDGSLGVAVALETVRALQAAKSTPTTAIEVIATADEEGRFGGMLGSQTLAGTVCPEWMGTACDADGVLLVDALRAQGLDPEGISDAAYPPGTARAFLELHIEQGPVLEAEEKTLGLVTGISGVGVLQIKLKGIANHSGTTPMALRSDAFTGVVHVAARIPEIIASLGTNESRVTIGKVNLSPNDVHTIPGQAEFSVVLRDSDEATMERLHAAIRTTVQDAAKANGLEVNILLRSWLAPVVLDPTLLAMIEQETSSMQIATKPMPSGAGHDAQMMQALCPSALIFVPSRSGVSHSPAEWTEWSHIEQAAQLVLRVVMRLTRCATSPIL